LPKEVGHLYLQEARNGSESHQPKLVKRRTVVLCSKSQPQNVIAQQALKRSFLPGRLAFAAAVLSYFFAPVALLPSKSLSKILVI
jgi:hypothetical protein